MAPGPPPPIPGVPKPRTSSARKASPPRPGQTDAEKTFQQKLDEIKRMRATTNPAQEPERRRVIVNGKPSLAISGDWALFASSSGRQYYFNLKTLVNQWHRPPEWCDVQAGTVSSKGGDGSNGPPPLPPQGSKGNPQPPPPPSHTTESSNGGGHGTAFKMKIKAKTKHKMKETLAPSQLNDEAEEENGQKSRLPPGPLYDQVEPEVSPKRSRRDSSSSSYSSSSRSRSSSGSSYSSRSSRSSIPKDPVPMPDMNLVMAAKAKIESQMAVVAAQYHSGPARVNNPTWLTEYNLPAILSRCKFPKTYDAVQEMSSNRGKKRNPAPMPDGGGEYAKSESRRAMVFSEIKNPNNRNRLLSEKLGLMAFKIPDELWERHFPQFQIDLTDGVKLESRPHAVTEDDKPVYTRTGKVAQKIPYPEDIVRCHAVIQAWGTETCHLVYANKTYSIQKDDNQWEKDLDECRKFLSENGY